MPKHYDRGELAYEVIAEHVGPYTVGERFAAPELTEDEGKRFCQAGMLRELGPDGEPTGRFAPKTAEPEAGPVEPELPPASAPETYPDETPHDAPAAAAPGNPFADEP